MILQALELETAIERFRSFLASSMEFADEDFDLARPYFEIKKLKKGEMFIEKFSTCRYFAFVVSGMMRSFVNEEDQEITNCICSENALATSTVSFITQTPSNISIQALENVELLTISFSRLQELYARSTFWQKAGRIIAEKEFIAGQRNSWRNNPIPASDKYLILLKENPGIVNRIPLHYIASYLNIKPETLSRIRKKVSTGKL
jgi:CRP-like cAMP-binding protein